MSPRVLGRCGRWAFRLRSHSRNHRLLPFSLFSSTATTAQNDNPCRPAPPPIQVALTKSDGRGVFATRRIVSGDLIHTAKPVVSHPSLSTISSVCYFCLKKLNGSTRFRDRRVSFCSEECREQATVFYEVELRADWSAHDEYCRIQDLKYPLLVKRFACMVISGASSVDSLHILQPASLSTLMMLEMEVGFGFLRSAFSKADITEEQMAFLTMQWYISVLARIRINAFRIELVGGTYEDLLSAAAASVEGEVAVGNAVYMLPSFYNHDCDPNAHIMWTESTDARLKALRDIDAGEELRICYIDASMDCDARQTLLSHGFGFHGTCLRCSSGD